MTDLFNRSPGPRVERKTEVNDRIEVRLGYYVIGEKPRMKGKWVWGQYAAMMPIEDFKFLVDEALRRGWFGMPG